MAIEFFDGFGSGNATPGNWTISNLVVENTGRFGYGLKHGIAGTSASNLTLTVPASARKTIGFAYKCSLNNFNRGYWLAFLAGGTGHLYLTADVTGLVQLRFGSAVGTILQTSTVPIPVDVWNYMEAQATIADSGGTCIVRVNGVEVLNYTGDTRNAGASTNIDQFTMNILRHNDTGLVYWDDFYVLNETDATAITGRPDNTFLGDVRVEPLLPTGNGAASQWLGSDANSTDNYLLIDEVPPATADYVGSGTVGQRDLWTLGDVNAASLTVFAVRPTFHTQKNDAGVASLKPVLRDSGGTELLGSDLTLPVGWAAIAGQVFPTRPAGGAWTVADVNGLQAGVQRS